LYLKSLAIFKKPSHSIKKNPISLEMSSKRIEIFKKLSDSLKIFLICHVFFKKASHSQQKLVAIAALPQWPVRP
jgi:hypothetical protein